MKTQRELLEHPPSGYTILEDKGAFHWYKVGLDLAKKYDHDHNGEPKSYPCAVSSEWGDDSNGPYFYTHAFAYPENKSVKCEHCGNTTANWAWSQPR